MGTKRVATGLLVAGSALALAACNGTSSTSSASTPSATATSGGSGQGSSGASVLAAAISKSTSEGSFKISGDFQITGGAASGQTANFTGAEQISPLTADLTMSGPVFSQLGSRGGGTGPSSLQVIMDNGAIYENIGSTMPQATGGKPWIEIDLKNLPSSMASASDSANSADPLQSIRLLVSSGDLTDEGSQSVNGTTATHYHGTITLQQALAATKSNLTPAERQQLLSLSQAQNISTETIDLWIDGQDRPVREDVVQSGASTTIHTTVNLSDWGTPVHVSLPPASEVENLSSLLGGASSAQPSL